jgi:hypothetical protein
MIHLPVSKLAEGSLKTSEQALFEQGEACLSSDQGAHPKAFDGVGKENASAHQAHNCCNRFGHHKRSIAPQWAKRHLPREKEWSAPSYVPIVRVVHYLTRWYDWRQPKCRDHGLYLRRSALDARVLAQPPLDAAMACFPALGMIGWLRRAESLCPKDHPAILSYASQVKIGTPMFQKLRGDCGRGNTLTIKRRLGQS